VKVKWTLSYDGEKKVFVLTEYRAGHAEWFKVNQTEWTSIDQPLEQIRKSNLEQEKERLR
jgi:hypothetical protein